MIKTTFASWELEVRARCPSLFEAVWSKLLRTTESEKRRWRWPHMQLFNQSSTAAAYFHPATGWCNNVTSREQVFYNNRRSRRLKDRLKWHPPPQGSSQDCPCGLCERNVWRTRRPYRRTTSSHRHVGKPKLKKSFLIKKTTNTKPTLLKKKRQLFSTGQLPGPGGAKEGNKICEQVGHCHPSAHGVCMRITPVIMRPERCC